MEYSGILVLTKCLPEVRTEILASEILGFFFDPFFKKSCRNPLGLTQLDNECNIFEIFGLI